MKSKRLESLRLLGDELHARRRIPYPTVIDTSCAECSQKGAERSPEWQLLRMDGYAIT